MLVSLMPSAPATDSNGMWTSCGGSGSPAGRTSVTPGAVASRRTNGAGASTSTRAPRAAPRGAKRMNCSVSPNPCSAVSSSDFPAISSPFQRGVAGVCASPASWRNESRDSYSRQPSANSPCASSASARFQCASPKSARSATALRSASIASGKRFQPVSARPRLFHAVACVEFRASARRYASIASSCRSSSTSARPRLL